MTSPSDAATTMYGVTAELVNAIPQLRDLLNQGAAQGWSQDKLNAMVSQSPWYQQNGQNLRNLLMQQATDPATFQANLNNAKAMVQQTANQMGRTVDAGSLAYQYMAQGWTADTLKQTIGASGGVAHGSSIDVRIGDSAQVASHLEQVAQSYGVPYTQQWLDATIAQIQSGRDTLDGLDSLFKARAKAAYPQFADQLDAGQTLSQIADPYMATMAKTLEIPQTQVTLNDPLVKQALAQRDPKTGAMTNQPLWQFEQTLKKDPRYGMTDQAKTDAYSMLNKIGQDWGMTGGGKA